MKEMVESQQKKDQLMADAAVKEGKQIIENDKQQQIRDEQMKQEMKKGD